MNFKENHYKPCKKDKKKASTDQEEAIPGPSTLPPKGFLLPNQDYYRTCQYPLPNFYYNQEEFFKVIYRGWPTVTMPKDSMVSLMTRGAQTETLPGVPNLERLPKPQFSKKKMERDRKIEKSERFPTEMPVGKKKKREK